MERAAVLIGVSRAGALPELQAVYPGIRSMERWASGQGFGLIRTVTDEDGREVTVEQIQRVVHDVLAPRTVHQVLIYFAGHGVNIGGSEYWLLSLAPTWTNQAVNVDSSERLARHSSAEHVVLVSDACRTAAAADTVFQSVSGSAVFPNEPPSGTSGPVDRFYACTLGTPALETRIGPAGEYTALYTDALIDALEGRAAAALEHTLVDGAAVALVRPRPLQDHLTGEVARRLVRLYPSGDRNQVPDAIITSRDTVWLSRLAPTTGVPQPAPPPSYAPPAGHRTPGGPRSGSPRSRSPWFTFPRSRDETEPASARDAGGPPETTAVVTAREALRSELHRRSAGTTVLSRAVPTVPGAADILAQVQRTASTFGTDHFETGCGIKVRGALVGTAESAAPDVLPELIPGGELVRVTLGSGAAADLLLTFDNDTVAVVPALQGFLTALTFQGRELVDLAFEPSATSWRYAEFAGRADELRSLRALISSANRVGGFRLDPADLAAIERRMQVATGYDPSIAVYAAYAGAELQLDEQLRALSSGLADDLGVHLFDVAQLAGVLAPEAAPASVTPMLPMLAQGWALLDAYRVAVAAPVVELRHRLLPSLWTVFDAEATSAARDALHSAGRIR